MQSSLSLPVLDSCHGAWDCANPAPLRIRLRLLDAFKTGTPTRLDLDNYLQLLCAAAHFRLGYLYPLFSLPCCNSIRASLCRALGTCLVLFVSLPSVTRSAPPPITRSITRPRHDHALAKLGAIRLPSIRHLRRPEWLQFCIRCGLGQLHESLCVPSYVA